MKKWLFFSWVLICAGIVSSSFVFAEKGNTSGNNGEEAILGVWLTKKQDSKVEIVKNPDNTYSGKLIWVAPPHQEYTGTAIIKGVTYDAAEKNFNCPWIYDPRMNITAHAVITVSNDTLYVKAKKGIITKNEIFTKVK